MNELVKKGFSSRTTKNIYMYVNEIVVIPPWQEYSGSAVFSYLGSDASLPDVHAKSVVIHQERFKILLLYVDHGLTDLVRG